MSDLKDIWTTDEGAGMLSEDRLMAYLEGQLRETERHKVESLLSSEGMESDALEGLQNFSTEEVQRIKHSLNTSLQKSLSKKRRHRKGLSGQQWNMNTVIVLLLLILMCFAVFWAMRHKQG